MKNAANGSAHMVVGNPHRKNPQIIRMNATALAARTQSSLFRLTIRPPSTAHVSTALVMSVLALLSFSPDLTVFFASNSLPGLITFSREPTALLAGSTSAHRPGLPTPWTVHCLSSTCCRLTSSRSAR